MVKEKKITGIKSWPADDRPREKLLKKGARALSNSELLAILLRTGTPGISAIDLARTVRSAKRHPPLAEDFCPSGSRCFDEYLDFLTALNLIDL